MTAAFTNFIASYGLVAVFVLMVCESCGLPFPSEVIMPTAGLLAATANVQGGLAAVIVVGAFANLVGSLIAYGLAARFGEPLLLGPGRYLGIRRHHLELADGWFRRWGLLAVLIGRVLPVVRTYISFPAGLARVDLPKFSILTFVGALPWCAALALAGYLLGENYQRISGVVEKVAIVVALLVVAVVVAWYIRGREPRSREV
ncbi:MAG TPA: DedA family protein [Candidatus Dormibacteraeota bacterium]|nr:DedA family protein [Candidatus Dormibacteraeota bacterium]